jgi:hypothetical protein
MQRNAVDPQGDVAALSPEQRLALWCEDPAEADPEHAAGDAERLFRAYCEDFIEMRLAHGFSESTYLPLTDIRITIRDKGEFGAVARVEDGVDLIEINSGTLDFLLWAACKCVLSDQLPFPLPQRGIAVSRRPRLGSRTESLINSHDIPDTPLARGLAVQIAFQAFLIVLFHELGHLSQGHCRYLKAALADYGKEDAGQDAEMRHPMEFMADLFALRDLSIFRTSMLNDIGNGLPTKDESVWMQATRLCYGDDFFALMSMYTALTLTFYLCSETSRRHPGRDIRFLATMLASKHYFIEKAELPSDFLMRAAVQIVEIVTEAIAAAHPVGEAFRTLYGQLATEEGQDRIAAEIERLRECFLVIQPSLVPLSKAEKAFLKFTR